jgi:hypothetical protein
MLFVTEKDGSRWLDLDSIKSDDSYIYDKLDEYYNNYNNDYDVIKTEAVN